MDGAGRDDDGGHRGKWNAQLEQCRGEGEKNQGDVVDVETGNEACQGTEHDTKEQGAQ